MEHLSLHTWLDALSSHPIFKRSSQASHATLDADSTFNTSSSLPPSPDASSIHSLGGGGGERDGHGGDESVGYLQHGQGHVQGYGEGARATACIARKTELCVASGRKIRVMNLASYKTRMENSNSNGSNPGPSASSSSSGSYKTLNTPAIDFEILQVIPSPSSRFLAVVGVSQLVVLELPRKGWDGLVSSTVDCSHDPIGPFYHSPSSPSIAKVLFHPWGEHDSILLVLTSDGLLREYDILHDSDEPTQVTDFCSSGTTLPSKGVSYGMSTPTKIRNNGRGSSSASASKALVRRGDCSGTPQQAGKNKNPMAFGDTDEGADVAVSFCIGEGEGDWSAFTLYCLMQNGDVYCVCPYLPKKARIPTDHLSQLASFISTKVNYLSTNIGSLSLSDRQVLESRYSSQLKFVNSLLSQRSSNNDTPSFSADEDKDNEHDEEYMTVKYPAYLRNPPTRQGPFLLQPSPRELEESYESLACDIAYVHLREADREGEMGVVLLAYTDGKVDVCLDVEKVEAQWGRLGEIQAELPSLLVYESIDLFGPTLASSSSSGPVQIVKDPEYSDSLYLYHSHGAHSLSLRPIFDSLFPSSSSLSISRTQEEEEASIQQALRRQATSEVTWLLQPSSSSSEEESGSLSNRVVALTAINDVYLGYALLLVTADMQLVSMELSFRSRRSHAHEEEAEANHQPITRGLIEPAPSANGQMTTTTTTTKTTTTDRKAYVAFSDSSKFTLPPLLTRKSNAPTTRFSVPASATGARAAKVSNDGQIELTIDSLRFVGETVEKLDRHIRDLISAGNTVQERLELHLRELPRQIGKYQSLDEKLSERSDDFGRYTERIEEVQKRQKGLERKADRLLQRLIDVEQPDLSSYERKWMEELDRVKEAVEGSQNAKYGANQSKGLKNRSERLKEQLDLLRPQLEDLKLNGPKKGEERMGESQRKKIEQGLAEEARLLKEARAKIERMQGKLRKQ